MTEERPTCVVCGRASEAGPLSACHICGEPFHLKERNDTDDKDCGQVWIDEQYLALRFACDRCLAEDRESEANPRVLRPRVARRRYRRRDV